MNEGTDIPHFRDGAFVQYVTDNVDHNIRTLDGHNTFHGMGMIAAVKPATSTTGRFPRVSITAEYIAAIGKVNIGHFISVSDGSQSLQYKKLEQYDTEDPTSNVEVLWSISMSLRFPRPACLSARGWCATVGGGDCANCIYLPRLSGGPATQCIGEASRASPQHGWRSAYSLRETLSPIQDQSQH